MKFIALRTRVFAAVVLAAAGLVVSSIAGASLTPAPNSPFAVGTNPRAVGVGDFNRDGLMDLVTANVNSSNISLLLGDGSGGFAAAVGSPVAAGHHPETLAVGDLNNDGNLDVVTTQQSTAVGYSGTASVLLGNGQGGLSAPSGCTNPFGVSFQPSAVAIGNFNQDGKPDLAIPNAFLNEVEIYSGNGLGCFTRTATFATGGTDPHAIAVADFDEDGDADLAVANEDSKNVSLFLGDGAGGFAAAAGSPFALGRFGDGLAVGDFDEDGHLDLAVSNFTFFSISVLLGDGNGGFAPAAGSPFSTNAASYVDAVSVATGDFDGDGHLDLATAGTNQDLVAVLFGAGNGGFAQAPGSPFGVGDLPEWVATADFDREGSDDLAVANTGSSNVSVLLGSKTTITVTKQLLPTSDPGRFDLKVGAALVKAAAGNGGSGALVVHPGTFTVKEVATTGTALSNYASAISCTLNGAPGPAGNGTSLNVTLAAGDDLACTITNKRKARVALTKHLSPTDDAGRFDLRAGGTLVVASAGDGSSGSALVAPGTVTVSETAASGTSISDYLSSIACTRNGQSVPTNAGTLLQLTLAPGDQLTCTLTNTRAVTGTIRLTKRLVPASDSGRFDLRVGPAVLKYGAASGGSGSLQVAPGTYSVREAAAPGTLLSDYAGSIACTLNGAPGPKGNGFSLNVSVGAGDVLACTLTNTRKATVLLSKHLLPLEDLGRFDLLVGSTLVTAGVGDGGHGMVKVVPGTYTVWERTSADTPPFSFYASSIACTLNGAPGPNGGPTSMSVTLAAGDVLFCTFTNIRSGPASISVRKMLVPFLDPGRFDLLVGDTVVKAAAGDNDFGDTLVGPGTYTVKELAAAGTGTTLANYASSFHCTLISLNGGPGPPPGPGTSLQVTLAEGDHLDCTFVNVRKAKITVKKRLVPQADAGRFDLSVDETRVKAAAGDGGAGSLLVAPGQHVVAEAGAGTDLSSYSSSIACTLNGLPGPSGPGTSLQVTVNPADQLICTITNLRE